MKSTLVILLLFGGYVQLKAQDTFSILAFDSINGEVGGAGASCVDLFQTTFNNHFIIELFPGQGAVACQANFIPGNQTNARNRFNAGDSPKQLISWMLANDIFGDPSARQYGVVRMKPDSVVTADSVKCAAYTGSACQNYKNHKIGPNYTIHGNILLGGHVLDSMEARFLREPGELACKLMAAMQGANMVGADSRCAKYGTSSLFAFLKVTHPSDSFGNPAFLVSLKTHTYSGVEPIDSLQVLFDQIKSCEVNTSGLRKEALFPLKVFPRPAGEYVKIQTRVAGSFKFTDITGSTLIKSEFDGDFSVATSGLANGVYFIEIRCRNGTRTEKVIVSHQ
jgi:uncharacterized Ntn-hydrolase superfamily protein